MTTRRTAEAGNRAAERQRRYRQRRASGRVCIRIEIDDVSLPQVLIDGGYLPASCADDLDAVTEAVERMHQDLIAVRFKDF